MREGNVKRMREGEREEGGRGREDIIITGHGARQRRVLLGGGGKGKGKDRSKAACSDHR
jgi:hypothetical protein